MEIQLNYVLSQSKLIVFFLLKKKSCYFQIILLFSKRLISIDLKKKDDHSCLVRGVRKHYWESTQQKEGPVTIKDTLKFFLYLRISIIAHSKLLME